MNNVAAINQNCVGGVRKVVTSHQSFQSFSKILNGQGFDPGYLAQVKAVCKEVLDSVQLGEKQLQDFYAEKANKDEFGKPIMKQDEKNPSVSFFEFSPDAKKEVDAFYAQVNDGQLILSHRPKLYLSKLAQANLTPADLINLEWLINEEK